MATKVVQSYRVAWLRGKQVMRSTTTTSLEEALELQTKMSRALLERGDYNVVLQIFVTYAWVRDDESTTQAGTTQPAASSTAP